VEVFAAGRPGGKRGAGCSLSTRAVHFRTADLIRLVLHLDVDGLTKLKDRTGLCLGRVEQAKSKGGCFAALRDGKQLCVKK
jgi:hypothetical protein